MIGIIAILLFGLFGLMFCVGCAGCLRPQWAKVKTRKEAAQMAGTAFVLALIVSPFLPDDEPKPKEQQTTAKDEQEAQHATEENFLEKAKREALANYGTATPEERRVRKVMENYWDTITMATVTCIKQREMSYLAQNPHAEKLPNAMSSQVLRDCLNEVEQATKIQ